MSTKDNATGDLAFPIRDRSDVVEESNLLANMIRPQLRETRRITIGMKGDKVVRTERGKEFRPPIKLDHFRITTRIQGENGDYMVDREMHQKIGEKPRVVPIEFLYDRPGLNFHAYLGLYAGRTPWCKGNGKEAMRLDPDSGQRKPIACPCPFLEEGKCKPHLVLQARLPGMPLGEVAKFRSTSKRTISYILSGAKYIMEETAAATGLPWQQGLLARLPLKLKLDMETVTTRDEQLRVIPTVGLIFDGDRPELEMKAREIMKKYKDGQHYLDHLDMQRRLEEAEVKKLLAPEDAKTAEAIVQEFHPGAVDEVEKIEDVPTVRDLQAEAKAHSKEKEAAAEILKASSMPEELQAALSTVDDDLDIGEGDATPARRGKPTPPNKPTPRAATPPPPPPKKKAPPKDDSFL